MSQDERDVEKGIEGDAVGTRRELPTAAWVVIAVVALAIGVAAGHFLLGGAGTISLNGRTTLSAGELDSTVATYTVDGRTVSVTAREVLEESSGDAELTANEDGTYDVPSASDVLTYAQNQIILADADARGLTATDDEVDEFVSTNLGTDLATLATSWGIDEDAARSVVADAVTMRKLQDEVATTELPEQPTAPSEPAEGAEDEPTAEYAQYVIGLLGDEWDADANDWARTDGTYYATLSGYEISNDAATYAAASAAYSVASSVYEEAYNQVSEELSAYTDALLSKATIQIGSLAE
ncbi:hypothetical protein [Olsenella sp. An270]|uniref:hypothetical protein n=1 Tax=Olsenella sp. An270 TaxID=1965615 RepID=UPI000B384457|nr:hypothetical protein [Olsenella sp. An270]OUO59876.1 hypothetical protein B5F73_04900 [Olsenella sp. An270]